MSWQKVKEVLPADQQQVLVKETSGVHVAVYNAQQKAFSMQNGAVIHIRGQQLEWMKLN